jgi:hypothetical protein
MLLVPPSVWNGVRDPNVVHKPRPFQPARGSSMRPSSPLAKKPSGYGTRMVVNWPLAGFSASSESEPLPVRIGVFAPSPNVSN